jgi:hypothetical protein
MGLEKPDEYISLARAAELSGLKPGTLRNQALAGKLHCVVLARNRLTTRRWLHDYLVEATQRSRGRRLPLPAEYVPPSLIAQK